MNNDSSNNPTDPLDFSSVPTRQEPAAPTNPTSLPPTQFQPPSVEPTPPLGFPNPSFTQQQASSFAPPAPVVPASPPEPTPSEPVQRVMQPVPEVAVATTAPISETVQPPVAPASSFEEPVAPHYAPKINPKVLAVVLCFVLLGMGIGGGVYAFNHFSKDKGGVSGSAEPSENQAGEAVSFNDKDTKSLVEKINRIFFLPAGETPKVGTVSNLDKIKSDPFFRNAAKGDKVLVYEGAKRAVLYRESENKVIEVGKVDPGGSVDTQSKVAGASTKSSPVPITVDEEPKAFGIEIRYSADLKSVASALAGKINVLYPEAVITEIASTQPAPAKTQIIDLKGNGKVSGELSSQFNMQISPENGADSESLSDFIITLGQDKKVSDL